MKDLSANQLFALKQITSLIEQIAEGKQGKAASKTLEQLAPWAIAEVPHLREKIDQEIVRFSNDLS